jgi:hypothetical protein
MEKDIIVLDHIPLFEKSNIVGERIKRLSESVDNMYRLMHRRRHAFKRVLKVKKIFNI